MIYISKSNRTVNCTPLMLVIHNYTRIESTCQEQQINWHHLFLNHGSRYINLPIFCAVAQYLCIYVLSVATVVNTEFTQSVYLYVYTTHTPPHGPCPPPLTAQLRALCNVMTRGESTITATFHHHIKDVLDINTLLVYDNCYTISCHYL